MDRLSKEERSWNMSRIRGKDTGPEKAVRSVLHCLGYRFRLHRRDLPGCPDVVMPGLDTVIFVHGCFWHRHPHCKFAYTPKSRLAFWQRKFADTVARDRRAISRLRRMGWHVMVIWECRTSGREKLSSYLSRHLGRCAAGPKGGPNATSA